MTSSRRGWAAAGHDERTGKSWVRLYVVACTLDAVKLLDSKNTSRATDTWLAPESSTWWDDSASTLFQLLEYTATLQGSWCKCVLASCKLSKLLSPLLFLLTPFSSPKSWCKLGWCMCSLVDHSHSSWYTIFSGYSNWVIGYLLGIITPLLISWRNNVQD